MWRSALAPSWFIESMKDLVKWTGKAKAGRLLVFLYNWNVGDSLRRLWWTHHCDGRLIQRVVLCCVMVRLVLLDKVDRSRKRGFRRREECTLIWKEINWPRGTSLPEFSCNPCLIPLRAYAYVCIYGSSYLNKSSWWVLQPAHVKTCMSDHACYALYVLCTAALCVCGKLGVIFEGWGNCDPSYLCLGFLSLVNGEQESGKHIIPIQTDSHKIMHTHMCTHTHALLSEMTNGSGHVPPCKRSICLLPWWHSKDK